MKHQDPLEMQLILTFPFACKKEIIETDSEGQREFPEQIQHQNADRDKSEKVWKSFGITRVIFLMLKSSE